MGDRSPHMAKRSRKAGWELGESWSHLSLKGWLKGM